MPLYEQAVKWCEKFKLLMVICVMKGVNRFDSQSCFTAKKYTRIIELLSKKESISLDDALSFFYHSQTYRLISEGVSDLHCMSDDYLAEELIDEHQKI